MSLLVGDHLVHKKLDQMIDLFHILPQKLIYYKRVRERLY